MEGRRRGSSLGFGSKLNLKIDQRRHSEHRLKVKNKQMDNGDNDDDVIIDSMFHHTCGKA